MAKPIGDLAKKAADNMPDDNLRAPIFSYHGQIHEFSDVPKNKVRRIDGIDTDLRVIINNLACGLADWPLFIHGEPGSGKTCAALCMIDEFGGWYTKLSYFHELLTEARNGSLFYAGPAPGRATLRTIWRDLAKANLFILDDLGLRPPTPPMYETMVEVLNFREGLPLVVTSNHDLDALKQIFDDRVDRRLRMGTVFHATGNRRTVGTTHTGKMLETKR